METNKVTIKFNQPKELPAEGLTTVAFKPWKNHVIYFLMQERVNTLFLPGGMYQTCTVASASPLQALGRITKILDQDPLDNM